MRKELVPAVAVNFVSQAEGEADTAMRDQGGVWTDGFGHTGLDVREGSRVTHAEAMANLSKDLGTAAHRLAGRVKGSVLDGLTDHEYAALLSFVFNLGAGASWTIWKVINAGQLDQVPAQFMRFVNIEVAGVSRVDKGLVNRRAAEVILWNTGDSFTALATVTSGDAKALPSSYTRAASTPPTSQVVKPLAKSRTLIAGGVSAAVSAAAVVQATAPTAVAHLAPHVAAHPAVGHVVAALSAVATVSSLVVMGARAADQQRLRN